MKNYVSIVKFAQIMCAVFSFGMVFGLSSAVEAASALTSDPATSATSSPFPTAVTNAQNGDAAPSVSNPGGAANLAAMPATPTELTPLSQPPPGIAIPAPPPVSALMPSSTTTSTAAIPPPPSSATLSTDAVQLATQAEQAAMQAQMQAESDQARRDREHIEKSYDRASNGLLPLNPDQIRQFMHRLEQTQDAAEPPSSGQPKGEVRVSTLPLDPGVDPPQINLAAGYITTITLVDASGAPWPILDVGVGGNFEVSPTTNGTHVIRVMPLTRFGSGDLSVLLRDLPTPIIFRLSAGGPSVDLRYDARIPKYGPNGKAPLIDHPKLEAGDSDMMMILENAPPREAKRLKISGLDARTMAWSLDSKVYVRTPLTLLSPAWDSSISSADGMKVYEIGDAPVLLMSDNGSMLRGRLVQEDNP